jgi:hypothetical protein
MSAFAASWLALREPYDARARNAAVRDAFVAAVTDRTAVAITDIACGTGATHRALAPLLPGRQTWRLADNDIGLLARAADSVRAAGHAVDVMLVDLARDLEAALDGVVDVVTMSALLDLVSADWLERFVIEAATRGLPVYAALSFDGRLALTPEDELDQEVIRAFNRHQRTDKGFGPALGAAAAPTAIRLFERVGYVVQSGMSDWQLAADDREIHDQMLAGIAAAASDIGGIAASALAGWLKRRRAYVTEGRAGMVVGHVDLFAVTTAARWGDRSQSNSTSSPIV